MVFYARDALFQSKLCATAKVVDDAISDCLGVLLLNLVVGDPVCLVCVA